MQSLQKPPKDEWTKTLQDFVFDTYIVLGTGGSSLGGQTLCKLKRHTRIIFIENIDPVSIDAYLETICFEKTGFIVISKSGETAETLAQLGVFYQAFCHKQNIHKHFRIITTKEVSTLRYLADRWSIPCIDHPPTVGGRFSAFTAVGMVPALLDQLPIQDFFSGAKTVLDNPCDALKGAAFVYEHYEKGHTQKVMMVYSDVLVTWSMWFRQLWAESLGKDGKGSTPCVALGTVDQHSQLQLFAEGPPDKIYTFLGTNTQGKGKPISFNKVNHEGLHCFHEKTMGDLFYAEQYATYQSLLNHKRPARLITLDTLDPFHMGQLMAHFMIETVIMADFMMIDAFSQPGVEESKRLTKLYLSTRTL